MTRVAPWWHTVLVLAVIAAGSIASAYQHGLPGPSVPGLSTRLSGYLSVFTLEWTLVFLIWITVKGDGIRELVGGQWGTAGAFFRDLKFAALFLVVAVPVVGLLARLLGVSRAIAPIAPRTPLELAVWLPLAASAGFAEELVFRGYLSRQFHAWTGSRWSALVLQGIAFGLAHGYYGKAMPAIVVHGWLIGLLVWWRKSLRPGMIAHALQDGIVGVVRFFTR
jgi:membrane protease YdiL (CAAX protease family)